VTSLPLRHRKRRQNNFQFFFQFRSPPIKISDYARSLLQALYYSLQNTAHTFQSEISVQKQQIQRRTSNVEINLYQIRQANLRLMAGQLSLYE